MELETENNLSASLLPEKAPAASATWPPDVCLYQPLETKQMLLPEQASCLAVQTYLRMCRLPYREQNCANAEFMSPGGRLTRLPLLRVGQRLLSEFEPIVAHVEQVQPEQALCRSLNEEQREQLGTMVTHVENTCTLAGLHSCFCARQTYAEHTWPRNGAGHPWPLSMLRRYERKQDALRLLRVYQWHMLDAHAVQLQFQQCLQLLDDKLQATQAECQNEQLQQEQEQAQEQAQEQTQEQAQKQEQTLFLWGKQPTQLDALLFGHVTALLGTSLPQMPLAETVRNFPRLLALCRRIDAEYHEASGLKGSGSRDESG